MNKLFIVPTPIGNLEDITLRGIRVLKEADIILAEDSRQTKKLLNHFNIEKKIISYHKYNEHGILKNVISLLKSEKNIALVSDAGTPGISDPGFLLVRECLKENILVECLPGPTALIPALINSGFPCEKFVFEGFLPLKKGRKTKLAELSTETRTIIIYESPFRLLKTLNELLIYFGKSRKVCVCRELTKIYEENINGTISELINYYDNKQIKGEIVIVIKGLENKINEN